jgi:hypothetical protein
VALLDILAKNPKPRLGLTDEVRDLYTRMTGAQGEAAMRFFHSLGAQQQQDIRSSVDAFSDGDFGTWFTVQYWLKQHGEPSALEGYMARRRWLEPSTIQGRQEYRSLRKELRDAGSKKRRQELIAKLDSFYRRNNSEPGTLSRYLPRNQATRICRTWYTGLRVARRKCP